MPRTPRPRPQTRRARRAVAAGAAIAALTAMAAGPSAAALGSVAIAPATVPAAAVRAATAAPLVDGEYTQRFLDLYAKVHDPANGYFSPQGIPYHARETLMVEAPDYGHETTSEAYSFWLWLEASYGQVTGDWAPFNNAWATLEKYMIPTKENQPTNAAYDPSKPATYAPEFNLPSQYPGRLDSGVSVGKDPLAAELRSTYGNSEIYGMHWLADADNIYGFGAAPGSSKLLGPSYKGTSYINTFQRGPQESVWETIPQPSIDDFTYGGKNGFLDLFTGDSSYAKQWKFTDAPDADARAVEATYWAQKFAEEQGNGSAVAGSVSKASKMGDYLRYAMYDKYFKQSGCASTSCAPGTGKDSAHYLLSWYYAWGGALDTSSPWAWRIGSSHAHFGYQNPMAAWALSNDPALEPKSPTAPADWAKSMERQLELYQWLQAPDGAIAGGATNNWDGQYASRPAGTATFYGLAYQPAPVYNDPPSNNWMGMQGWGVERVAQLYEETGNARAKAILDKWVPWVLKNITVSGSSWQIPSNLEWTGQPDSWNAASPGSNSGLSVKVTSYGQDVGVAGALARTLMYYAAGGEGTVHDQAKQTAHDLLDAIVSQNSDQYGVATTETRADFDRFDDKLTSASGDGIYVPSGWTGTMPNGDVIKPGVSFLDIRSFYKNDPDWAKVQTQLDGGAKAEFTYHRFWAQTAIATAMADYDRLFGDGGTTPPVDTQAPTAPSAVRAGTATATSIPVSWTASTDNVGVTGYTVLVNGTAVGTATTTSYTVTGLTAGTQYSITVTARDAAGNVSTPSTALTASTATAGGTPDTQAPTVPSGLAAGTATTTSVPVSWTASSDNVAVTGYSVSVNGTVAGTVTGTSYTITGLAANTSYTVTVAARDAAGNTSAASAPLTVKTATDTTTPPTGSCTATYKTINAWQGGYQGEITVKAGTSAITTWTVTAPSGLSTSNVWGGKFASGVFTPEAWNGSLAAGATTTVGFIGNGTPPAAGALTCG